ncbi:MAG: outer membrane protein assembly factor BamA, partial [Nitrospinota bacterium]
MPLRARRWASVFLLLALSLAPLPTIAQEPAITVRAIEVRGNRRIEQSTIRFYIQLREGQALTSVELVDRLRADVKRIYGLGFFRDVRVDVEPFEGGLRVIYVVREKPVISRIEVVGHEKLSLEKVRERITVKVQTIVNEATLKESVRSIRLLYQEEGYYFARVEALLQEIRPDAVSVTFRIDEGESVLIESIGFTGNESIREKELLGVMVTSEGGFFSFLTGSGIFQERQLRQDLLRLRLLYQNRGFVKVQVGEPIIREDRARARLHITIPIVEGLRYRVGRITLRGGEAIIPPEELRAGMRLREGGFFNRSFLIEDVQAISERFAQQGHAFADVSPDLDTRDAERRVDVRIGVAPGRRVFIGRVNIRGNTRTRDNVIRREFLIPEGSLYDVARLKRSRLLIERLNYFEEVKVVERRRPRAEDILDIDIEVKEKPTGVISGGMGFSSVENFIVALGIREENLFGRGWIASLDARLSSLSRDITASFTDPNFRDLDFSLGGDLFFRTEEFDDFDSRREGGRLRVGRAFTTFVTAGMEYELVSTRIENISGDASLRILEAERDVLTS